jgi:hypothetical protein
MSKKRINFRDFRRKLATYLKADYKKIAEKPEFDAIISHFILDPTNCPPLATKNDFDVFTDFLVNSDKISTGNANAPSNTSMRGQV